MNIWNYLLPILIVIVVYAVLAYLRGWFPFKKAKSPVRTTAQGIVLPTEGLFQYNRPDGGHLFSVYAIPAELIATVTETAVRALQDSIHSMRVANPGWNNATNSAEYPIVCIEPMAINRDGSPALIVGGVQSAGTVVNVGTDLGVPPIIVLPAQREWNFLDYFYWSIYNENEHGFEWNNDRAWFWQFAHEGDVHQHWPVVPRIAALFGGTPMKLRCAGVHLLASSKPYILTPKVSAKP